MEIITVSGPPPDDPLSPEYLAWHEQEFVARATLVLNQSSQIEALQAHVRSLERRVVDLVGAARGLVKPPPPPPPLELVEDKNEVELPDPEPESGEFPEADEEIFQPPPEADPEPQAECAPQDEGRTDPAEDDGPF